MSSLQRISGILRVSRNFVGRPTIRGGGMLDDRRSCPAARVVSRPSGKDCADGRTAGSFKMTHSPSVRTQTQGLEADTFHESDGRSADREASDRAVPPPARFARPAEVEGDIPRNVLLRAMAREILVW